MSYQALLYGFDAATLAGAPFNRGGTDVTIPAAASQIDGGRYVDALSFLCGYGAQRDMDADLTTNWVATSVAGAGTMVAGIDADDRFYVHCSVNEAFTVAPTGADDPWGWGGSVAAVAHGTGRRATATGPWTRGVVDVRLAFSTFTVTTGLPGSFTAPEYAGAHQSIPTLIRYNVADTDDTTATCLANWDNDATDNAARRINWGLDDEGRVFCSWPVAVADLTWNVNAAAIAFRSALGFTGAEVVSTSLGRDTLTAVNQCPGVKILRRGFSRRDVRFIVEANAVQLMSGQAPGRTQWTATEHEISFGLRGVMSTHDEASHALATCFPLMGRGQRVSMFGLWGDPRRARTLVELRDGSAVDEASKSYTAVLGGLDGRRMCRISPNSPDAMALAYALNSPRTRAEDISLVLREV